MHDEPEAHVEPVEGPELRLCAKCGQLKHPRLFRRTLTLAQAEARGYFNHHIRPMTVPSKFCTECQPGRLRPSEVRHLPTKRLINEAVNNRGPQDAIAIELLRRARKQPVSAQERGTMGAQVRWEKFHADRWRHAKKRIKTELQRLTFQSQYYRRKLESDSAEYFGPHYKALLAFNDACAVVLRELRAQATGYVLRCTIGEDNLTWRDWMGATKHDALTRLWRAIPEPDEATLAAAFGKRTARPTFRARLLLPMVMDMSNMRFVFTGGPTAQYKGPDDDAKERAARAARVATMSVEKARKDNDETQ